MKKVSVFLMVVVLLLTVLLPGCTQGVKDNKDATGTAGQETAKATTQATGTSEQEATATATAKPSFKALGKAPKDTLVCLSLQSTQNDFMAKVVSELKKKFEGGGFKFEYAAAEGSSQRQIEQIENFITMGADEIIVMAVEPTSLKDVCQRAIDQGVVVFAFTQNTKAYTTYLGANEEKVGQSIANLASKWVDKTYTDSADGSVNTVIFSYSGTPEAAIRSSALQSIAQTNKKVKITKVVEIDNTTVAAQGAAENLAQTNPETNLIVCYNGGMAIGVNSYAMSPGSIVKDKSKFGVFGSELTAEITSLIEMSATDKSVLRGTAQLGGGITVVFGKIYENSVKILNGQEYTVDDYVPVDEIDVDNIAKFKH
jgi:ribose transport system substrate-binding protein